MLTTYCSLSCRMVWLAAISECTRAPRIEIPSTITAATPATTGRTNSSLKSRRLSSQDVRDPSQTAIRCHTILRKSGGALVSTLQDCKDSRKTGSVSGGGSGKFMIDWQIEHQQFSKPLKNWIKRSSRLRAEHFRLQNSWGCKFPVVRGEFRKPYQQK